MERRAFSLSLVAAVLVTGGVLWNDWLPLGVPGEWTWARVGGESLVGSAIVVSIILSAVYTAYCLLGVRRIESCGRIERTGWLIGLPIVAFLWQGALLDTPMPPHGYARGPWILYYPRSSGYFWQARYEVEGAKDFLAHYEELLAEQDYLHIGTHPPGLTLGYWGLLKLTHALPDFANVILATAPNGVQEASEAIRQSPLSGVEPLARADEACLWLASLITQLSAVVTSILVYLIAARHADRQTAWHVAVLWPLVPAALVFLPKSDVLFPFLATLATWLWFSALDRRSLLGATLAGLVLWAGMFLSLAFITVGVLIGVMTAWEIATGERDEVGERLQGAAWLAGGFSLGFAVPVIALWSWCSVNLLNVWSWNFANHALFYEHNTRTWWAWLLVNPLELAFGVGLPLLVAMFFGAANLLERGLWKPQSSATAAVVVVWCLLWLSGKNMGEAARLWILLMPWIPLAIAEGFSATTERSVEAESGTQRGAAGLLVAQCLVAILTVLRIDGFHFSDLLRQ